MSQQPGADIFRKQAVRNTQILSNVSLCMLLLTATVSSYLFTLFKSNSVCACLPLTTSWRPQENRMVVLMSSKCFFYISTYVILFGLPQHQLNPFFFVHPSGKTGESEKKTAIIRSVSLVTQTVVFLLLITALLHEHKGLSVFSKIIRLTH